MSSLAIHVEVAGSKYANVFEDAIKLAKKTDCLIAFNISGFDFVVNKNQTVKELMHERYIRMR